MIDIEEVRKLPYVGDWDRPPARSTLMKLPKADIIEYVALAFKNWHSAEETIQRGIEYHKRIEHDEEIKLT